MAMSDSTHSDAEAVAEAQDEPKYRADYTPWLDAILTVAKHYRLDYSAENVRIAARIPRKMCSSIWRGRRA
jgi:ATP-binding cassette subfamily C protein LapB